MALAGVLWCNKLHHDVATVIPVPANFRCALFAGMTAMGKLF
jgi:hypothetical protein